MYEDRFFALNGGGELRLPDLPQFGAVKTGPFWARRIVPTYYGVPDMGRRLSPQMVLNRDLRRNILGQMGSMGGQSVGGIQGPPKGIFPSHLATKKIAYSKAKNASGGLIYEVVRATSAAAVNPTQQREWLVGIWVEGGGAGGAGALQYLYDGVHTANFPVGSSQLDPTGTIGLAQAEFYPLNYGPIGQSIPAAPQTFTTGLGVVRWVLSNRPNAQGFSLSDFVSVFVSGNESGTGGTSKTYTIPGPLGKPTGILALSSDQAGTQTAGINSGEIDFPAIANYAAYTVPALFARGEVPYYIHPVPDFDPSASFALTHKANALAGTTGYQIAGFLYYRW